jgi:hypothetical protein
VSYDLFVEPPAGEGAIERQVVLDRLRSMPGLVEEQGAFVMARRFCLYPIPKGDEGADREQIARVHIAISLADVPNLAAFDLAQALASHLGWSVHDAQLDGVVGSDARERVLASQQQWARVARAATKTIGNAALNGLTLVDGWYVKEPEEYRLLVDHAPPRPYGYLDQLKNDLGSLAAIAVYGASGAALVFGIWRGPWWLAALGGGAFYFFASMYPVQVKRYRNGRLIHGRARDLRPMTRSRGVVMLDPELCDMPVVVDLAPFRYLEQEHGGVDVLILKHDAIREGSLIGMRGATSRPQSSQAGR